jgi:hypothetical protein
MSYTACRRDSLPLILTSPKCSVCDGLELELSIKPNVTAANESCVVYSNNRTNFKHDTIILLPDRC